MFYTTCRGCRGKIWDGQDGIIALDDEEIRPVVYCSINCLMRRYDAKKECIMKRFELEDELEWHEDKRRKRMPMEGKDV